MPKTDGLGVCVRSPSALVPLRRVQASLKVWLASRLAHQSYPIILSKSAARARTETHSQLLFASCAPDYVSVAEGATSCLHRTCVACTAHHMHFHIVVPESSLNKLCAVQQYRYPYLQVATTKYLKLYGTRHAPLLDCKFIKKRDCLF